MTVLLRWTDSSVGLTGWGWIVVVLFYGALEGRNR